MQNTLAIGVDIGGTHISCAAVQIQEAQLLSHTHSRATYNHESSSEIILQNWANALNDTISKIPLEQLAGIGFAIPGPFDYRNGVSKMEHKFKDLLGLHIPKALNPLLNSPKVLPMRFLNDASSFAVGEAWMGEGQGFQRVVVITLGTGFGSAFVEDGVPVVSGERVPKEGCLWHLPYKDSIADDYFSTRWFVGEYAKITGQQVPGVKQLIDLVDSDAHARNLFLTFGENLAERLAAPLQTFEADLLVIGGNISHALPLFGEALQSGLNKAGVNTKIAVSKLKENAALLGSARLLDDEFWAKASAQLPNI